MHRHLVTVKVSVETFANQWMQVNRITFHQRRLKRLNTHPVQSRGPVQHNWMILDHKLENIPYFFIFPLEHLLGALDRIGMPQFLEFANDERLIQLKRDFLRQTTLMQLKSWANHDHTSGRVIDSLTQ